MAVVEERVNALAAEFTGSLLRPGDAGYDDARRLHNGLIDKHPALIARCGSARDVARAIGFAREIGLEISVRGGGHNVAGRACIEGGLMIDLAEMRAIDVDPEKRTVRAQGGANWAELNAATGEHGLAVTGGAISTTGIAGLTLGGGLGWLMGLYGLAADNLVSVELVTANGDLLDVAAESHPDLFWALRGGGGNFGVVTTFEYRLHPVATVTGGLIAHPFAAAGEVLRFYRDFTQSVPDELTVFSGLVHAPDGSGTKLVAMVVCHCGQQEQAERDIAPLLEFGSPAVADLGPLPYPVMNTLLDAGFPAGALNYWKSSFVRSLDDVFVDAAIEAYEQVPSPMSAILLEHFHGAVTRVPIEATAVPHRAPGFNNLIASVWTDPDATEQNVAWTRSTYDSLRPSLAERRWLNYLDDDDPADAVRAAYGPNYDRLVRVKRQYDPENVFRSNHNIDPGT
jgi:FAD/FMN-containing dehydrogenase